MPEKTITENRQALTLEEEDIMVAEVTSHGRLLNMETLNKGSVLLAAMAVTDDNFLAFDPSQCPPAWQAVRLKRAIAREEGARYGLDEATQGMGHRQAAPRLH